LTKATYDKKREADRGTQAEKAQKNTRFCSASLQKRQLYLTCQQRNHNRLKKKDTLNFSGNLRHRLSSVTRYGSVAT